MSACVFALGIRTTPRDATASSPEWPEPWPCYRTGERRPCDLKHSALMFRCWIWWTSYYQRVWRNPAIYPGSRGEGPGFVRPEPWTDDSHDGGSVPIHSKLGKFCGSMQHKKRSTCSPIIPQCAPRQSVDVRTATAAWGHAAFVETCKSSRPMVVGAGHEPCQQNWRHTLADRPAGRSRDSKSVRRSAGLLARPAVCKLWSLRAQHDISRHPDVICISCNRRRYDVPQIGAGLRAHYPHFAKTYAAGCRGIWRATERMKRKRRWYSARWNDI